jgi:hypothetical protein
MHAVPITARWPAVLTITIARLSSAAPRGYCLPSRALWVTVRTMQIGLDHGMPAPPVFVVVAVDRNASLIICRRRRRVPPQGMPRSGRSCAGACQVSETSVPGQAHQSEPAAVARHLSNPD